MAAQESLLYERVARMVEAQIASGTLRGNERIPSVRSMSRTAKARPQSGFYVRPPLRAAVPPPRPKVSRSRRPTSIATETLDTCREALARPDILQLNGAFTSPTLYPNQRLNNLIREVLRDHPAHAGECLLPPGHEELRRQVAKRMTFGGAPADPAHVVITGGAMDAITMSLHVLCKAGDTVLVESPTYFGVLQVVEYLGLKVVEVPNHTSTGIDVDAVRNVARTTRLAAAVLMPNFNARSSRFSPPPKCPSSKMTSTETCITATCARLRCAPTTRRDW
jgi:DNA-binding transcriptional MocR family regulator